MELKGERGLTIQDLKVVKTQRSYLWRDPSLNTSWGQITAELACGMLNAGSLLNKAEELADLAIQKNLDITWVTETWLHDGIRDDKICLPGYIPFCLDRPARVSV